MSEHYIAYEGKNVALAAMKREYIPIFMEHANDLTVTEGILMRPPFTLEEEYAWYDSLAKRRDTDTIFAILHRKQADGADSSWQYIGHTGLHKITWPDAFATTGTVIWDKSLHSQGCGTEAKLLLLYHAFMVKGLRKISSEVKSFNASSWGHLLKCGYKEIGRRKAHHLHEGTFVDCILFEIFQKDFEGVWQKYKKTGKLPTLTEDQRAYLEKETGRVRPAK